MTYQSDTIAKGTLHHRVGMRKVSVQMQRKETPFVLTVVISRENLYKNIVVFNDIWPNITNGRGRILI